MYLHVVESIYFCSFWWWDIESDSDDEESGGDSDWDELPPAPKKARGTEPKTRAKKPDTMTVRRDLKSIFENTAAAAIHVKISAAAHLELLC